MRATARAHNVGVMLVEFPGDPLRDPHEEPVVNLIWATRGRTWGFRFLLDGEYASPLATYESAFVGTEYDDSVCRAIKSQLTDFFHQSNRSTKQKKSNRLASSST